MTSLPTKIVLHLGAHKTASTHLQKSIAAAGPFPDVAFWGPQELRQPGQSIAQRFGLKRVVFPDETAAELRAMSDGMSRLVLSDENFAGGLQTGWGRLPMPPYPKAQDRVAVLASRIAAAKGPKIDLCLAIRDPAAYLTSAYSQILHGKRVVDPAKFMSKNPITAVDWADYVARLRAVSGVRSLTVWRQEDYAELFDTVTTALIGEQRVAPITERSQRRLSERALDAALSAKATGLPNVVAEAAIAHPVSARNPPFRLFDQADMDVSARLYASQCDAIAAMDGVTLLRA